MGDQLRRDDESKSQSRDALSNALVATRQNVADRESQLQQLARQLQDEKNQNKNNSGHIEELKSAMDQLKRDLQSAKRQKKNDAATKNQIQQMKKMIEEIKQTDD